MRELVGHQRPKSNAALGGLVVKTPDELGGSTTSTSANPSTGPTRDGVERLLQRSSRV